MTGTDWRGQRKNAIVAIFDDNEELDTIRKEHSAAHFDYLSANRGKVVIAGGLRRAPGERYCDGIWVIKVESRDEAEVDRTRPVLSARAPQELSSTRVGQGALLRYGEFVSPGRREFPLVLLPRPVFEGRSADGQPGPFVRCSA